MVRRMDHASTQEINPVGGGMGMKSARCGGTTKERIFSSSRHEVLHPYKLIASPLQVGIASNMGRRLFV